MLKSYAVILASAALASFCAFAQDKPAAPNDAQIAMIAVVADSVDIDAGKMAIAKTQDKKVKEFAELMVRDHAAVNDKAIALAKKLGVTPEESAASKGLKANGDAELAKLQALTGKDFDKAYVDNEVAYHEAVAGVLDNTLLPNTRNAELKSLLESARPVFLAHLEHAKMVQNSLK